MAVKINGVIHSFANALIRVGGIKYPTIQEVNFEEALESTTVYGTGSYPLGDTQGEYKATGDFSMLAYEMEALREQLSRMHPRGSYAVVKFDVLIHLDNGVDKPIEVKLVNCRIKGQSGGWAKGSDPSVEKAPLTVEWIERNGKRMLSAQDAMAGFGA